MKIPFNPADETRVIVPPSIDAALSELARGQEKVQILAGCTDATLALRRSAEMPGVFLVIGRIAELCTIKDSFAGLVVGAAVTMTELVQSTAVSQKGTALSDAALTVGGIQIRNAATIGGNICSASPGADTPPALLALNASVEIAGPRKRRQIPLEDFFVGPRQTSLGQEELLLSLNIPFRSRSNGSAYLRLTTREALDLAVVGAAAVLELEEDKVTIADCRIALGAVAPTPLLVPQAGEALVGKTITDKNLALATQYASDSCRPIDDVRASADYRRKIVPVLVRRAIIKAFDRAARQ